MKYVGIILCIFHVNISFVSRFAEVECQLNLSDVHATGP